MRPPISKLAIYTESREVSLSQEDSFATPFILCYPSKMAVSTRSVTDLPGIWRVLRHHQRKAPSLYRPEVWQQRREKGPAMAGFNER